jgi:methylglutaconyl-CoA hydratase
MGERQARRYFLTAERFDAHEAKRIGLVHEVADDTQLDHEVEKFTHALLSCSPHAMDEAKRLIRDVSYAPIDRELIADTVRRIADIRSSAQGKEGVQAFLQKRKPSWLVDITHDQQYDKDK